jgi:hypothetical protein
MPMRLYSATTGAAGVRPVRRIAVKITKPTPGGALLAGALLALSLALVPGALAGKTSSGACVQAAPTVAIDNTYAWATWGSWGMPGQQLKYAVKITNNDSGCSSSTFNVSVSAPSGFTVSPTSTIDLSAKSVGYVWASITSPASAADGDYQLSATVSRAGAGTSSPQVSAPSYYKVYSSDTSAPSLFWPSPDDGSAISGKSYNVGVMANDDHEVKTINLYLDGALTSTTSCPDISYNCELTYTWRIGRVHGRHTARFEAYDWMGNESSMTETFTVN